MDRIYLSLLLFTVIITDSTFGGVLECEEDTDCIDESNCVNNICECERGYVFSTHGDRCLEHSVGYGSACEDDAQCSWLMGRYHCNSGACDCDTGYRYLHGRCVPKRGLGETCTRNEDCYVTNHLFAMVCSNEGRCICNEGYYVRGGYDCRPEVTEINGNCALDSDCQMENSYCNIFQCTAISSRNNNSAELVADERRKSKREVTTYAIGSSCTSSDDCGDVTNAICSPLINQCVCRRGYFYSAGGCVGEIGLDVGCTENSECPMTPKTCVNGACICPISHYHSNDLTRCVRVAYTPNFPCTDNTACQILHNDALCLSEGIYSYCYCPLNTVLNNVTFTCDLDGGECAAGGCLIDAHCAITNAICSSGTCICPDNYRLEDEDNICLPNIGGACDSNTKFCELEDAACINSVCSCTEGYVSLNETTCIKAADGGLYDSCEYDIQCSSVIENSACARQKCECVENYMDKEGVCLPIRVYGAYCTNIEQCHVALGENVQCRNSICQCPADMIRTKDGLDCTRSSSSTVISRSSVLYVITLFSLFYLIF